MPSFIEAMRKKKMFSFLVVMGIVAVLFFAIFIANLSRKMKSNSGNGREMQSSDAVIAPELNLGQAYAKLEQENRKLKGKMSDLAEEMKKLRQEIRISRQSRGENKEMAKLKRKIEDLSERFKQVPKTKQTEMEAPGAMDLPPTKPAEPITAIVVTPPKPAAVPIPRPDEKRKAYLPPGSMVSATLVTGVDAPTSDKAPPLPVLLSFPAEALGPSLWKTPVKGCLMIGEASGDEATERVRIKVYRLSCVRPDGAALVREVVGWVVGEDGREGVPGVLVSKQGEKIAQTLFAEMAAGFGKALSENEYTTTTTDTGTSIRNLTGDALSAGVYGGIGRTAEKLAAWLTKKAEKLLPVVSIDSARKVKVVFLRGTDLGTQYMRARNHAWAGLD